jgi:propanol-preferring alcohol dehydrogenase
MLNVVSMSHTQMAAQLARVLGHLTIVGVSSASLPVNFCDGMLSFGPYWGYIGS